MRFWDSSALLPLVVRQSQTPEARKWLSQDSNVVVWTLTPVEMVSAICRLVREGRLDEKRGKQACMRTEEIALRAHLVHDIDRTKLAAVRLLKVHALGAADSLQLGASLLWADAMPAGRIFHTFDRRLALAASREGFTVLPDPL